MGPLKDVKIIEFAGIGPGPFCGMLLADLGAEVIRIERKDNEGKGDINVDGKLLELKDEEWSRSYN